MPLARNPVYRAVIRIVLAVFRLFAIDFDVRGARHIPAAGPAVLACNHIGFLDFTFVGLAAHRRHRLVRFMAKKGTFTHPVSGPLMRAMRHIPVDRTGGSGAFRMGSELLAAGELVGIFPEATISRAWTLKPFHRGAAALAVARGVPLIPIITWGGHRLLTVDGHRAARRHIPVSVWVGEPIEPSEAWRVRGRTARDTVVQQVSDELRSRMAELLDRAQREYPQRPRSDADRWWLPRHLGGSAPDPEQAALLDAERMLA